MDDKFKNLIELVNDIQLSNKFINITGSFGTGKTFYIEHLINYASESRVYDAVVYNQSSEYHYYFHEFIYDLASNFIPINVNFQSDPKESEYNRSYFHQLLNNEVDTNLFTPIQRNQILYSKFEHDFFKDKNYSLHISDSIAEKLNRDDLNFLNDAFRIGTETLIIDILNYFINLHSRQELELPDVPYKVLIAIDNIDHLSGSVCEWISEFINFVSNSNFSEFKYFKLSDQLNSNKIKDFISFTVVLGSRFIYNYHNVINFELKAWSDIKINNFLENKHSFLQRYYSNIKGLSFGIPALIELCIDSLLKEAEPEHLENMITQSAYDYIIKYYNFEQIAWLEQASLFEDFDITDISLLPGIDDNYEIAYYFLRSASDICRENSKGKIEFLPNIKYFILNYLKLKKPEFVNTIINSINSAKEYKELLVNVEDEDKHLIKQFYFLNRFDRIFAIQDMFADKAGQARKILETYPNLFKKNQHTYSLNEKLTKALNSVFIANSQVFFDKYKEKVKRIWDAYSSTIKIENDKYQYEIEKLKQDEYSIKKRIPECEKSIALHHEKLPEVENRIEKYKIDLNEYFKAINPGFSIVAMILGIIIFAVSLIFREHIEVSFLIGFLLISFTLMGFGFSKFYKVVKTKLNIRDYSQFVEKIQEFESERDKIIKDIELKKLEIDNLKLKIKHIEELIEKFNKNIESNRIKLEESFVDD